MKMEDAEEYTQSLGQIVTGSWRQIAWAERNGVPKALGLTTREWVTERLGGYIKLEIEDRREAVRELAANGMSQREIGDVLGVSPGTVNADVQNRTAVADEPEENDGEPVQNRTPSKPRMSAEQIAAKEEESVRRTLIDLTHAAFTGIRAWGSEGFADRVRERMDDPAFREFLLKHLRSLNIDAVRAVAIGAKEFRAFLAALEKEERKS